MRIRTHLALYVAVFIKEVIKALEKPQPLPEKEITLEEEVVPGSEIEANFSSLDESVEEREWRLEQNRSKRGII